MPDECRPSVLHHTHPVSRFPKYGIIRGNVSRLVFDRISACEDLRVLHGARILRGVAGAKLPVQENRAAVRAARESCGFVDDRRRFRQPHRLRDRTLEGGVCGSACGYHPHRSGRTDVLRRVHPGGGGIRLLVHLEEGQPACARRSPVRGDSARTRLRAHRVLFLRLLLRQAFVLVRRGCVPAWLARVVRTAERREDRLVGDAEPAGAAHAAL